MANKNILLLFILFVSGLSLVIFIPPVFLSFSLYSYGTIEESVIWYFPEDLSPNVDLNIIADVGDIKIEYVEPSSDTYGKIDVNFKMCGVDLAGKSYTDYFSLEWETTNSSANLTLKLLSESWFDPSLWSMKNVSIVVSLRKDIIFDIITTINEGDFELLVPYGVSVGDIITNISVGNILYHFEYCIIGGNITGSTYKGDLELKSYDVEYTQNCNWTLDCKYGDMGIEIYQNKEMGANITGTAVITNGNVKLVYKDNTANIGAKFDFNLSGTPEEQLGFTVILWDSMFSYKSLDFPTKNIYRLLLNITGLRSIDIVSQ
ncbi:MAG: hypothetical protein ACFFD2_29340 [Promethearchaeota archaeon]